MDPFVTGSLITAGSGLLGGIFGSSSTKKANAANTRMQYDFAKNSIQWKTEDAKRAGLHPLAALGAQGYSPTIGVMADNQMGNALADAGASIGNAVANRTAAKLADLQLKGAAADIAVKEAQARYYNSQAVDQAKTFPVNVNDFIQSSAAASTLDRNNQNQSLRFANMGIDTHKGTSNAGDFEERYGEILGSIMGAGVAFADAISIANDYFAKPRDQANAWLEKTLGFGQKKPIWNR